MNKGFRLAQDRKSNKTFIPVVKRETDEPPPIIVAIVGPAKVGKSTLVRSLVKHYTKQKMNRVDGPITVVSGKYRRITFIECPNDLNSMIDIAKVADLVLLMVDASFGFEMEVFEFLNVAQVHGMPRVMGVLTHLDLVPVGDKQKKIKTKLKHRFWTELYQGAKLFYLSRLAQEGQYMNQEISNLARFISVIKFRPIMWRQNHPYVLVDRVEDLTDPEELSKNKKTDRTVALYGFSRGAHMNPSYHVHIAGVGDFVPSSVTHLPDPAPLPKEQKKRSLNQKERILYAPLTGQGGFMYDKDAVYLDVDKAEHDGPREGEEYLSKMADANLQAKMKESGGELLTLLAGGNEVERRPANFEGEEDDDDDDSEEDDNSREEEEESEDEIEGLERREVASDSDGEGEDFDANEMDGKLLEMQQELEGSDAESEDDLAFKNEMHTRASNSFYARQSSSVNLKALVYDTDPTKLQENTEKSEVGDFFVKIMEKSSEINDKDETKKPFIATNAIDDEDDILSRVEQLAAMIKDSFVTGDWGEEDAEKLLEEDDALYGDFEDLEKSLDDESGKKSLG